MKLIDPDFYLSTKALRTVLGLATFADIFSTELSIRSGSVELSPVTDTIIHYGGLSMANLVKVSIVAFTLLGMPRIFAEHDIRGSFQFNLSQGVYGIASIAYTYAAVNNMLVYASCAPDWMHRASIFLP